MNESYQIHPAKEIPWKLVKKAKRIVIKLGTRALINEDRSFDPSLFQNIATDIGTLFYEGKEIIIVSSGAVNAGVKQLGLVERPREMVKLQVLAAIGNPLLMAEYQKYFTFCKIGQVLVTQEDFSNRISYNNFRNTLTEMLKMRVIPIINENDVISVNELQSEETEFNFTDNDILAGLVAASMESDLLLILSDIDGLYTKHPNSPYAEFVPYVPEITPEVMRMGKGGSKFGRGGMTSKIIAANIVTKAGGCAIVAHAKNSRIKDMLQGSTKLTFFGPSEKLPNKQIWLLFGTNVKGRIYVDKGAKQALLDGASLLFQGINHIFGRFKLGDIVGIYAPIEGEAIESTDQVPFDLQDPDLFGYEMIFRGKARFSSEELVRFSHMGKEQRKEYFHQNHVREIILHEDMAATQY
jgi:glutamate 5-kinase